MGVKMVVWTDRPRTFEAPYLARIGGWTLERYLTEAPEDQIWEFARGEVLVHSPATAEHQRLVGFLYRLLQEFCERTRWGEALTGPAALQILPDVVREPDVFVLAPEDIPHARGVPLTVRPVLIIEVTSPSTRTLDREEKAQDYAQAGVPEYWVVDPEHRELWVYRQSGETYQAERVTAGWVSSVAVRGFALRVEWLWQDPLPSAKECLEEIEQRNR
ncbi:Uma2 family endonuclease [Thermoflexus hugenholtzii]|uniref:Endonuclease, Uma2 family (Restriction endonuclease fold) n=1 Tax=Thermoflexus hugenholtzii JAD2 TaxID=877466 RepID=A0A212QWZ5_9CHLR|nr:Uma2 family endonuclease [Thermoflexus hugenholtzii]SNB64232.1 Endonuclease, Uma2 family (restriction endonuclease fold) [Thermoflexus hugenholtzii JAD2]